MTMVQIFDSSDDTQQATSENFSSKSDRMKKEGCSRPLAYLLTVAAAAFFISTIVLAILLGIKYSEEPKTLVVFNETSQNESTTLIPERGRLKWPEPSGSLYARYKRAAIATDHGLCSGIGRDILMLGGNAIDATVAALVCVGVVNPQSSGLGGGFIMTIYNSSSHRCVIVNARETAPAAANETMYSDSPEDAVVGYRSIATPSELHGLWTVFTRFGSGKVSWYRLFRPSIELALNGFPVSANLAAKIAEREKEMLADPVLKRTFVNPQTGKVYVEGDIIKREHLGATLELIANNSEPVQLFYEGGFAQTVAAEIEEHGGYVTTYDLNNYKTKIDDPPIISEHFIGEYAMCGPPPPSSSAVTQSIIATMAELYAGKGDVDWDDPLLYHRLVEAEKFAYAQRTKFGDAEFVPDALQLAENMTTSSYAKLISSFINDTAQPLEAYGVDLVQQPEDHGTSHVSAIDAENNAVSCTSTINQIFGSMRISPTLGIVWNDEMDDFSIPGKPNAFGFPPSPANYIEPGKRPFSSMSPLIIYNKITGQVKMVVGTSGGSQIISATAQAVIRTLIFNQTVKEAVDAPRFHNQFIPPQTSYELPIPQEIIANLAGRGQNMTAIPKSETVVQALVVSDDGYIYGNSDFRRQTATFPAGF